MQQNHFLRPPTTRGFFKASLLMIFTAISLIASAPRADASGSANQCMVLFETAEIRNARIETEAKGLVDKLKASMKDPKLSLNHRGVFASHPALSPELEAAMSEFGVMAWGARIYVAKSVEAAMAHSAAEPDLLMQGNYIIRPDATLESIKALKGEALMAYYRDALKADSFYYIENSFEADPKTGLALIDPSTNRPLGLKQTVRKVDPHLVAEVVHPEDLSLHTDDLNAGPFFYQSAWAMPRLRGIIDRENIYDPVNSEGVRALSGKYVKSRALARKLHAKGFKFTFNRDFKQSLDKVRDQKRRNPVSKEQAEAVKKLSVEEQAKFEDSLWVANSRYKEDPALYASTLAAFGHGKAFSVEVWNEKGELVGGIIGKVEGGVFSPESTFYNEKQYPDIGIMFSMITVDMLGERLAAAGLRYQDAGMVSPFTKAARGQLVTLERFLEIKDELNRIGTKNLDLTSEWVPPAAVDYSAQKKKNRGPKEAVEKPTLEGMKPIPLEGDLQATADAIIARAEASLDNPELSLSYRGFVASGPPPSPALNSLLAKRGIFNWGVRFFVVDSIGSAKKHSAKETDNFMQGNYIVIPGFNEAELQNLIKRSGPEAFRDVIAKGELVYVENSFDADPATGLAKVDPETKQAVGLKQRVRRVRRDVLEQSVDPDQMVWQLKVAETGPYLVQSGWVLPQGRGVIERDNIFNPPDASGRRSLSTSYKNILYFARKKAREGFTFTFNRDFRRALDMTRDQERRNSDGSWSSETSRYKDLETYNAALESFNAGTGISVEVWNEKGELVGGALAFREGPIFKIDSVYYDNRRYPSEGIDFAKAAGVMLGERLADAGIDILDMEMLSPYSKSLRGRVVPTKYFFKQIDGLNPNAQVDLVTPWSPPLAESYRPPGTH
jgi:Leu/Phe-tRNA-protein transferase